MLCGWRCGVRLTGSRMRAHFADGHACLPVGVAAPSYGRPNARARWKEFDGQIGRIGGCSRRMTRGLKPVRLRGWTGVPEACAGTFTLMHTPCAENRSLQHTPQSRAEGMFVGVRLRRRTHWSPDVRALHPLGE